MANNNTKERIARNEERIKTLFSSHEQFRDDMMRCQETQGDRFRELRDSINMLANEQYHELIEKIDDAKQTRTRPLNKVEWTAIIIAAIGGVVSIITAFIQYGVLI